MKALRKITPEGTKDLLFEACQAQRDTERTLSELFLRRGYHEVLTPGFEYFDLFRLPGASIPVEEMYKMVDSNGRILAMRADSTLPIARMTAARLQGISLPIRLFYNQTIYRNRPDLSGHNHERPQMGIELLGAKGLMADLEVLSLAVAALNATAKDFRLELGNAALFQSLIGLVDPREEEKLEIQTAIESKNDAALCACLRRLPQSAAVEALRQLPKLFGGVEVLKQAKALCLTPETEAMRREMKQLYGVLDQLGLGDRLMLDLGMAQKNDYYTGVIFNAYTQNLGEPLLVGGRYDKLLTQFDAPMPAIGFSLNTQALAQGLLEKREEGQNAVPDQLIFAQPGFEAAAIRAASEAAMTGLVCELALCDTVSQAIANAKARNVPAVLVVGETKEVISTGEV